MYPRNSKAQRALAGVALSASAVLGLAACSSGGDASSTDAPSDVSVDEIVIGLIFPTTGQMAVLGVAQQQAVEVVLDWANENGGIDGVPIRVVEADSQSDPGVAATQAQRLIDQEDIDIIVGSYSSGLAASMLPVAQRNDVILWEVGSVSTSINPDGQPNFFRTIGNATSYAGQALDFFENFIAPELGEDFTEIPVAFINEDGAFGQSVADVYAEQAEQLGLNVVLTEQYSVTTPDFTPLILKLKEAGPEVVFMTPSVADAQLFWQQAGEQAFNPAALIGTSGITASSFPERFGAEGVEGVFGVEPPALSNMNLETLDPEVRTLTEEFIAKFKEVNGADCLVHCGDGIGGAYLLVSDVLPRALEESGDVSPEAIIAAAAKTDLPAGATPQGFGVKFDMTEGVNSRGDNTLGFASIMQWHDGKLVVVWPSEIAAEEAYVPMPTFSER